MCCADSGTCTSETTFSVPLVAASCPGTTWRVRVMTMVDGDPTGATEQCNESLNVFLECDDGLHHLGTTPDWNGCEDKTKNHHAGPWELVVRPGCDKLVVRHAATSNCQNPERLRLRQIKIDRRTLPVEECNGIDDDCDGIVDEGFDRVGAACDGPDSDSCANGTWTCGPDGATVECTNEQPEGLVEICNGLDDDCDGAIDEEFVLLGQPCDGPDTDSCANGAWICDPNQGTPGASPPYPYLCGPETASDIAESCNGLDDDCDGDTDEGFGEISCGVGPCAVTVESCVGGVPQTCTPGAPAAETCNGEDDDCDGTIDNGFGEVSCGVGACATSVESCVDGVPQSCTPGAPADEICNGQDDDCDGETDEGFGVVSCGVGACEASVESCVDGAPQTCTPGAPADELCDGVDNDCDGETDEGFDLGASCLNDPCGAALLPSGPNVLARAADAGSEPFPVAISGDGWALVGTTFGDNIEHNYAGQETLENFLLDIMLTLSKSDQPAVLGFFAAYDPGDLQGMLDLLGGFYDQGYLSAYDGMDVSSLEPLDLTPADLVGIDIIFLDAAPDAPQADFFVLTDQAFATLKQFQANGGVIIGSAYTMVHWTNYFAWQRQLANPDLAQLFGGTTPDLEKYSHKAVTADGDELLTLTAVMPWLPKPNDPYFHSFWALNVPEAPANPCVSSGAMICSPDGTSTVCDAPAVGTGVELCGNQSDDDCDCAVDEGFEALGDTCEEGTGACADTGTLGCSEDLRALVCSATPGEPSDEVCDGIDNNCDGATDEGFGALGCGEGACAVTVAACLDGAPQTCTPGEPTDEVCDGVDNDCDGDTDEELGDLTCGVGACAVTVTACVEGAPQTCTPGAPSEDICDGIDNDCDGATDEELGELACGVGACTVILPACIDGAPQTCTPGTPTAEICDGIDNDCNGDTDEGTLCDDATVCTVGEACVNGGCTAGEAMSCDDGDPCTDDWCDAVEGCVHEDNGQCACPGTLVVVSDAQTWANDAPAVATWDMNARWTAQIPGATWIWTEHLLSDPVNDTFATFTRSFTIPPGAVAITATLEVSADNSYTFDVNGTAGGSSSIETNYFGTISYDIAALLGPGGNALSFDVHNWAQAGGTPYSNPGGLLYRLEVSWLAPGTEELCDGVDNDCDGDVDEGLGDITCGTGGCAVTVPACIDGAAQACIPETAEDEQCDGEDNDCDGAVDEELGTVACGTGACATSVNVCVGGVLQECEPLVGSAELCDGLDNDCDGEVDEDYAVGLPCLASDACGYGTEIGEAVHPCVDMGATACMDGDIVCEPSGCHTTTIWQLGSFEFNNGSHPDKARAGAVEYPANDAWTATFDYTVGDAVALAPDMPGYLNKAKMSSVDPNRRLTDATTELRIHFELAQTLSDPVIHWSRYGTELNTLLLDGAVVTTTTGTESVNAVHEVMLAPLTAGSHVITLRYDGGGAKNGNYIDALRLVATTCGAPGYEICGNGIDDDCSCSIDEETCE